MSAEMKRDFGRVAVLMGGWAREREISLLSGTAVLEGLLSAGIDAVGVDVGREVCADLAGGSFDCAFNVVHGPGGEDGVLQGVLETLQLRYTGSGVAASALSMDKLMSKKVWQAAGMSTPRFRRLTKNTDWQEVVEELGLPLMVKPACEGSSFGLTKVDSVDGLEQAWKRACLHSGDVFAEQWVSGKEYTVGILNGEALPVIELRTENEFYDFEAKYERNDTEYLCPCDLDAEVQLQMAAQAQVAFLELGAVNWGRIDIMRDTKGINWLIELNTVPGMTSHSLVPMAAAQRGMSFSALVCEILRGAMEAKGEALGGRDG